MIPLIAVFFSAMLFAFGLGVAGLLDPNRITGFLDVAGAWNPGPLYVMASAMIVYFVGFRLVTKRPHPLYSSRWYLPTSKIIDAPLVGGAALFGVGWGLSGYCPGPVIAGLALGYWQTALVATGMFAGAVTVRRLIPSGKP